MTGILDAHGQAVGAEPQQERGIDQGSNVPQMIGLHVAQEIAKVVAAEMADYVQRNAVPSGELHVNITAFSQKSRKNKLRVEFVRQKADIRIVGTPTRTIEVEWGTKVR